MSRPQIDYPPSKSPSVLDIAFTAGFYEGEGNISVKNGDLRISIPQNDREILDKIRDWFGGYVYGPYKNPLGNEYFNLLIVRERGIGFIYTIYSFLSKSRREQARLSLNNEKAKREYKTYNVMNKIMGIPNTDKELSKLFKAAREL